jgi:serine/threonine protein kinase
MSKRLDYVNQEIIINNSTQHKNIVKLYNYYKVGNYMILLLEYMNNKDLKYFIKKFLAKHGYISEALCAFFILDIIVGLKYLKESNILHRDIKPDNIMIDSSYTAKIGDFSLSKTIDPTKSYVTSRSGTIPYLCPEALKTKNIQIKSSMTERLDVFSLGIIMYYMLFNEHPFKFKVSFLVLNLIIFSIFLFTYIKSS